MSAAIAGVDRVAHAVALSRLQASRRDEGHNGAPAPEAADATGFADTMPLWFRSEALAEDVSEQVGCGTGQEHAQRGGAWVAIDRHVLASGALVLRQTLQAFKQQRW